MADDPVMMLWKDIDRLTTDERCLAIYQISGHFVNTLPGTTLNFRV
jgi:hypothetical protein